MIVQTALLCLSRPVADPTFSTLYRSRAEDGLHWGSAIPLVHQAPKTKCGLPSHSSLFVTTAWASLVAHIFYRTFFGL